MFCFSDHDALKRQGAQDLLNGLPGDLPGLLDARVALACGQPPAPILRLAWEGFCEQHTQELTRLVALESELEQARLTLDAHFNAPILVELRSARATLLEKTALAETLERNQAVLRQTLERELLASEQEICRLKAYILDQNRVIAQQQLRFEKLTGEKPLE